jgi:uncharacterized membrane protein YphA (DoxX/SURF4 family)
MTSELEDTRFSSPYWALRVTYIVVPLVAGLDKFFNLLTYWPGYLSHRFAAAIPMAPQHFMYLVGVVEIVVGLLVASRYARAGAYIVMLWLICIALNLIARRSLDIAVRDLAMAVGAFALARLETARTTVYRRVRVTEPLPV